MHSITSTMIRPAHGAGLPIAPRAGTIDDIRREDDKRGYERDETDSFRQLVAGLVVDGDRRAGSAGRHARRTLAEMSPGYKRQPVLLLTRPLTFRSTSIAANQACTSCHGAGGKTVDTSSDGVSRQHWQSCGACSGSGAAR
ncbi:hypothetical protein GCM10010392_54390 [Streptomyces clavifer]|nr:hypothetical protein GCM10010392_54390 [Streptomyces clavifer]